jgi:signal transduction histidine kinase
MSNKQTAVEWLEEQFRWMLEDGVDISDVFHSTIEKFNQAKFIERENILDFALFVKREGWALKTGKNIDDLYNDFLNK